MTRLLFVFQMLLVAVAIQRADANFAADYNVTCSVESIQACLSTLTSYASSSNAIALLTGLLSAKPNVNRQDLEEICTLAVGYTSCLEDVGNQCSQESPSAVFATCTKFLRGMTYLAASCSQPGVYEKLTGWLKCTDRLSKATANLQCTQPLQRIVVSMTLEPAVMQQLMVATSCVCSFLQKYSDCGLQETEETCGAVIADARRDLQSHLSKEFDCNSYRDCVDADFDPEAYQKLRPPPPVEIQPDCSSARLERCYAGVGDFLTKSVQEHTDNPYWLAFRQLDVPRTNFTELCKLVPVIGDCVDKFVEQCSTTSGATMRLARSMQALTTFARRCAKPGSMDTFLDFQRCHNEFVKLEDEECSEELRAIYLSYAVTGDVFGPMSNRRDPLRFACCILEKYEECGIDRLEQACGQVSADNRRNVLESLMTDFQCDRFQNCNREDIDPASSFINDASDSRDEL